MLEHMIHGFAIFSDPAVWIGLMIGTVIGYIIGAMPGIGPTLGVALLIPFTYGVNPIVSIVSLVALYSAAEYGGAITSILVNAPGSSASIATAWDGYPMTRRGEAGAALNISIVTSGIGAFLSAFMLALTAIPLAEFALSFGPTELFALAILGLSLVSSLSQGSALKGALSMFIGLALAMIGLDTQSGVPRFAYTPELFEGVPLVPALIGLYAISEVFYMIEDAKGEHHKTPAIKGLLAVPLSTYYALKGVIFRSTLIGYIVGVIPGGGPVIASFVAYGLARRTSKSPETFGHGNPEGVAASETANNAAVSGVLAPLLALGIPGSPTTAILIGALMIQGIQPGPLLFTKHPEIPYSIFASLWIGVPIMVFVGLAGAKLWAQVANIPKTMIAGMVSAVCFVGAYASTNTIFPVYVMTAFGLFGYVLRKAEIPLGPIILSLVLADLLEANFRRAMVISKGSLDIFFQHPITLALLAMAILSFAVPLFGYLGRLVMRRRGTQAADTRAK
jgi:putative tricarboxylic transport membrane protein